MFGRKRSAEDFAAEIEAHLELEADELRGDGIGDEEARWRARQKFGNVCAAEERFSPVWAMGLSASPAAVAVAAWALCILNMSPSVRPTAPIMPT